MASSRPILNFEKFAYTSPTSLAGYGQGKYQTKDKEPLCSTLRHLPNNTQCVAELLRQILNSEIMIIADVEAKEMSQPAENGIHH